MRLFDTTFAMTMGREASRVGSVPLLPSSVPRAYLTNLQRLAFLRGGDGGADHITGAAAGPASRRPGPEEARHLAEGRPD